ncbi:MAG: hypothetical protein R6W48_06920 [Gaiellaceae bacterium]
MLLYTGGTALAGLALVDRGSARAFGWLVAAASPICLAVVLWGLWSFAFDGGSDDAARAARGAVLVLLVGLVGSTGMLLARDRALVTLAYAAGVLVPVLQRFTTAGDEASIRTLAQLDGVELVASRGVVEGVHVETPVRGEHLFLRRTASEPRGAQG